MLRMAVICWAYSDAGNRGKQAKRDLFLAVGQVVDEIRGL